MAGGEKTECSVHDDYCQAQRRSREDAVILLLPRTHTGGGWLGKVEGEKKSERRIEKESEGEKERKREKVRVNISREGRSYPRYFKGPPERTMDTEWWRISWFRP